MQALAQPLLTTMARADAGVASRCSLETRTGAACANACTGESGFANARRMTEDVARALGCQPEQVLVASTGVIGVS